MSYMLSFNNLITSIGSYYHLYLIRRIYIESIYFDDCLGVVNVKPNNVICIQCHGANTQESEKFN